MERVERIRQLVRDADAAEGNARDLLERADGFRWKAAELIVAELAEGKSQRQLADEIGKRQGHVSKCATIWARYGADSPENRPAWQDAYREVSGKRPEPAPEPVASVVPAQIALGPGVVQGEVVYDEEPDAEEPELGTPGDERWQELVARGREAAPQLDDESDDDSDEEPWTEEQEAELQAVVAERKRLRAELTGDENTPVSRPVLRRLARERLLDARWSRRDQWWVVTGPSVPLYASCSDDGLAMFMTDPDVQELVRLAEKIRAKYVSDAHVQKWTALARGEK